MLQQLRLPVITREIASYLNTNDAYHLAQSCKVIQSDLSLTTLLPIKICEDRCWQGQYHDGDIPRCGPKIPLIYGARRTHSVEIQCKWKDQGWGNRKGQLFIVGHQKSLGPYNPNGHATFVNGYKVCKSPIADHVSTNLFMSFTPREGMYYCVWYVVGGGGGHELKVSDLTVICTIVGIDDYDSDNTRNKYRAETFEKLLMGGVFMDLFNPRTNSLFYITLLKSLAQSLRENGGIVDPILASWFRSNHMSMEEGSLVALEELTSFLITCIEDEEYCHNNSPSSRDQFMLMPPQGVDYDDEDEMPGPDMDFDDADEMDPHDYEAWQDSDESESDGEHDYVESDEDPRL